MLIVGEQVKIRYSHRLDRLGLKNLVNRKAIVRSVVHSGDSISGAYVDVRLSKVLKRRFVPIESIENAEAVDKLRTLTFLKTMNV